eukprot:s2538_g24.t1
MATSPAADTLTGNVSQPQSQWPVAQWPSPSPAQPPLPSDTQRLSGCHTVMRKRQVASENYDNYFDTRLSDSCVMRRNVECRAGCGVTVTVTVRAETVTGSKVDRGEVEHAAAVGSVQWSGSEWVEKSSQ